MASLPLFRLEEYLSQWEFIAPYLLCCSDAESRSLEDILSLADRESKEMCEALLREEGVLLLPARIYDYRENYFRLGVGRRNMLEALDRFDRFLKRWDG